VCKIFLSVSLEEYGHVEDIPIRKLHLQTFRSFVDGYNIFWWDIREGWLTAQLPFLALRILQFFGSLDGDTHLGVFPECGTQHESLERGLRRNP
jgi:hypothetical protein